VEEGGGEGERCSEWWVSRFGGSVGKEGKREAGGRGKVKKLSVSIFAVAGKGKGEKWEEGGIRSAYDMCG